MPCRVQGVTYMNLGKRLSAALELLAECDGSIVADIGSDHAYLAVAALKSGAAKRAIAFILIFASSFRYQKQTRRERHA